MQAKKPSIETGEYVLRHRRSPAPLYAVGATWLIYALILPLYAWYHYLIVGVLSAIAYLIFTRLFPPVEYRTPVKHRLELSGERDVDRSLREAQAMLDKARIAQRDITSRAPPFGKTVSETIASAERIMVFIARNPSQANLLRRFFNYYLPTLVKLLDSYITFDMHGSDGRNTVSSKEEIVVAVATMGSVFERQLDKLLGDTALDITTDIDVLETMLKSDGLNPDNTGEGK